MSIRLRAHHLLCVLTYVGRGYTPAFTVNYDAILARLMAGEPVELVEGPDEICAPLLGEAEPHCRRDSVRRRDELARAAVLPLLGRKDVSGPFKLSRNDRARLRAAFAAGDARGACRGCEWSGLCDAVAAGGFAGARLR